MDKSFESVPVFDPRGVIAAPPLPPAPRVHSIAGLRLAVLSNSKWNANKLLRGAAQRLHDDYGIATFSYYQKEAFSRVAPDDLIREIAANNDIALTAIGD